jgi:hypothetical protein
MAIVLWKYNIPVALRPAQATDIMEGKPTAAVLNYTSSPQPTPHDFAERRTFKGVLTG